MRALASNWLSNAKIRRPDPNNDEKASLYVDHIDSPASTREALYSSE